MSDTLVMAPLNKSNVSFFYCSNIDVGAYACGSLSEMNEL